MQVFEADKSKTLQCDTQKDKERLHHHTAGTKPVLKLEPIHQI